jgi:DNA-binding NarL/FixJ family response regulator
MRVALVDDHVPLRRFLRTVFEEDLDGVEVVGEAETGEEAVDLAGSWAAELVVMDWQMPGIDGVEATRRIKASHPGVEIVGFTSSDDPELRDAFLEAGATEQFIKDDVEGLVAHVRGRLNGQH